MKFSIKSILLFTLIYSLAFTGCTGEKPESKSMAQIYREEGVPVRVKKIIPRDFSTQLSFHSYLSGIRESTAFAAMDDKVEKIHVKIGDFVKKDQILITFPTDSPTAHYFQARVAFDNARQAYERLEGLYKAGGISLQERDNAKAHFDVAAADWRSVKQMIKVKAPISGYVTSIHISETENVKKKAPLITIARTDRMKATLWVSESEITSIRKDMEAVAVWQNQKVQGTIVQVDMAMNLKTRAFRAVVEFDNSDNFMKAGTTVDVKITTASRTDTIVVQRKNLMEDKKTGRPYVFITQNKKAKKNFVTLGQKQEFEVEIIEGLKPGDRLVEEGQMMLEDGSKVKTIVKTTGKTVRDAR